MKNAGLTRRTVVVGGGLALLVGTAFAVVLLAIADMRQAALLARHSEEVLAAANRLERLVIDLETGQRGFAITGDARFLEPWNDARRGFPGQAQTLERLATAPSAEQGRRARRIARSAASYIAEYSVPVVEATRRDRASVLTVAATQEGKRRVDAIRIEFDRFTAAENQLAATSQERSRAAARRATLAAAAGVTGSILLVLLFTGYLTRTIVRPVRRAAAMVGRLAAGDLTVRLPETGAEEIGTLERAFNAMGGSLETSHHELRLLVEEQAALRRVATLVARAVPPAMVFDAVCAEVARLLDAPVTRLLRFEPGRASVVAGRGDAGGRIPVGDRCTLAREDAAALEQELGVRSSVGGPVVVDGRFWGVMAAGWTGSEQVPAGAEGRLTQLTELVATAIANADSRVELAASRARVVAAADEIRRRIERDLHDGTQQRLVSLALDLRTAEAQVPPRLVKLRKHLSEFAQLLSGAVEDLQEISRASTRRSSRRAVSGPPSRDSPVARQSRSD